MVITILCGQRPKLLRRTLFSLFKQMPQLKNEKIIVLINGKDDESLSLIKRYGIKKYLTTESIQPIGVNLSILAELAYETKERLWFHLEDDWQALNSDIDRAVDILDKHEEISQVRMRLDKEPVLNYHMITGEPIIWQYKNGYKVAKAHYTMNPSLIRTTDIHKAYPCTGERDAQKNWLDNQYVAQLVPGIFKHIGVKSLRKITKCEP